MALSTSTSRFTTNDIFLYIICLGIGALILLRDVGDISYNKYLLLAACSIPMLFLTYSNFLCLLCFLFALTFGIPSNFVYLVAIGVLIAKKSNKIDSRAIRMFALFSMWTLFDHLIYGGVFSANFFGFFLRLFLLFVLINEDSVAVDYNKAISLFSIGVIISCFAILGYYLKYNSIDDMIRFGTRLGDASTYIDEGEESGMKTNTNANYVACFCNCAMCCFINIFVKNGKTIWAVLFFIVFGLGMLTVSRAFIVLGALTLFAFVVISARGHLHWYLQLLFFAILSVAVYYFLQSDFVNLFGTRFDNESLSDDSRGVIFSSYWNAFWGDPLSIVIGAGVYTHREILYNGQSTHNMIQQVFVSYGLFGAFIFLHYLFNVFKLAFRDILKIKETQRVALITIVVTILYQQTIQYLAPSDLMLPTIIGMFAIKNIKYSELNK